MDLGRHCDQRPAFLFAARVPIWSGGTAVPTHQQKQTDSDTSRACLAQGQKWGPARPSTQHPLCVTGDPAPLPAEADSSLDEPLPGRAH